MHKAKRFKVPKNNFLIFDGNLIHGSGTNEGKNIRFAIVFGIIEKENLRTLLVNLTLLDLDNQLLPNHFSK